MSDEAAPLSADNVETEVKLGAPVELVVPDLSESLPDLSLDAAPTLVLDAVYHDTSDLALVRNKVSLRHRVGEGAARWTLKLPKASPAVVGDDDGVLRRREIDVETDDDSVVPESLARLVTGWTRGAALKPVITLRSTRHRTNLARRDTGAPVGEIDDDSVDVILDGRVVDQFHEIEVEVAADATPDVLPTVTAALRFAGAGEPDPTSKVGRALGTRAAVPPAPLAVVVDKHASVSDLVRGAFTTATLAIIRADHAIRLDDDPAGVRGAATGARHLRADLRTLRPFLVDDTADNLRDELGWFIAQLAQVRDLDVVDKRVRSSLEHLTEVDQASGRPIVEHLAAVRRLTRAGLVTSMSSSRYTELLAALVDASAHPPLDQSVADDRARTTVRRLVRRPVRRLQREVANLPSPATDLDLSQVRRRVKHARFAAHLLEPVAPSSLRRLSRSLVVLQDELGGLDDALSTEVWLRSTASLFGDHSISLVAGQLIADQRAQAQRTRTNWPRAWASVTDATSAELR